MYHFGISKGKKGTIKTLDRIRKHNHAKLHKWRKNVTASINLLPLIVSFFICSLTAGKSLGIASQTP
jgi:hypothetical protein